MKAIVYERYGASTCLARSGSQLAYVLPLCLTGDTMRHG